MQTGEKLAVCPSGAVCSTSVSIAFPQGDDMDAADFAQALFNITSSGLVQVCTPPLPATLLTGLQPSEHQDDCDHGMGS